MERRETPARLAERRDRGTFRGAPPLRGATTGPCGTLRRAADQPAYLLGARLRRSVRRKALGDEKLLTKANAARAELLGGRHDLCARAGGDASEDAALHVEHKRDAVFEQHVLRGPRHRLSDQQDVRVERHDVLHDLLELLLLLRMARRGGGGRGERESGAEMVKGERSARGAPLRRARAMNARRACLLLPPPPRCIRRECVRKRAARAPPRPPRSPKRPLSLWASPRTLSSSVSKLDRLSAEGAAWMAPPTMAMRGCTTCVGMRLWATFFLNAMPSTTLLSDKSPSRRLTCTGAERRRSGGRKGGGERR